MSAETDLRDRLIAERENARTAAEALAAVGRYEWFRTQYAAGARTVAELTCPPTLTTCPPRRTCHVAVRSPDEAAPLPPGC